MDSFFAGMFCGAVVLPIILVFILSLVDGAAKVQCEKMTNQECVYVPHLYKSKGEVE